VEPVPGVLAWSEMVGPSLWERILGVLQAGHGERNWTAAQMASQVGAEPMTVQRELDAMVFVHCGRMEWTDGPHEDALYYWVPEILRFHGGPRDGRTGTPSGSAPAMLVVDDSGGVYRWREGAYWWESP
jgi:hypothetical protein